MVEPWDVLKLLADPTRLRLVNLLRKDELSVAELQEILGMGQSRISSHLGLLRGGELVTDRKDGKRNYYTVNRRLGKELQAVIESACEAFQGQPVATEDSENLQRVLEKRRRAAEQYFNMVAGRLGRQYCPGRGWEAIGHFLLHLVPPIKIADLGAGEGMVAQLMARQAEHVYCIDSSPKMVEVGTDLAQKNDLHNLEYRLGDIEDVPLPAGSVHMAILSQALHHAVHPERAILEAYRILKPRGKLVVLDLKEHHFEKAREEYADRWLGFSENTLHKFLREAGFQEIEVNVVFREQEEPHFETLLAAGVKG